MAEHIFTLVVYESTADCCVTANALIGTTPTEIGQLAELKQLNISQNQMTGASRLQLVDVFTIYAFIHLLIKNLLAAQVQFRRSWDSARLCMTCVCTTTK